MTGIAYLPLFACFFIMAVPVGASGGAAIPEPSDLTLFLLGLIGVIIGRQGVIARRRHEGDQEGDG